MEQIEQTFGVIAVMVLVIIAAYFITRYIAAKANGAVGKTRQFRLIDRFSVSKDKMFVLISVGHSTYLIGISNQSMTVIDRDLPELSADDGKAAGTAFVFSHIFSRFRKSQASETFGGNERGNRDFTDYVKEAGRSYDEQEKQ